MPAWFLSSLNLPTKTQTLAIKKGEQDMTSVLTALEYFEVFLAYFWVVLA